MKNYLFAAAALILVFSCIGELKADSITLNYINGDWDNPIGGEYVVINNGAPGTAPDMVTWGDPLAPNTEKSGYTWEAYASAEADTDGTPFALGDFTHDNFTIKPGGGIDSVDLLFELGYFDGGFTSESTFLFDHVETPNGNDPEASRDIVSILNPISMNNIMIGGETYLLELLGFSQDGGTTISTEFYTYESDYNEAVLYARLNPIPEPTSLLLLGTGIGALGLIYRRRKQ